MVNRASNSNTNRSKPISYILKHSKQMKTAKSMISLSILFVVMAAIQGIMILLLLGIVSAFFWNMWLEEEIHSRELDNDLWERIE